MADLFGFLGGGQDPGLGDLGGISHRDATTLSLLQALQGMSEAGTRRTATPIGSIAQTLAPLLMAPIQARQVEQESALKSLLLRAQVARALGGGRAARTPEQVDLDKARADEARARAEQLRKDTADPFRGRRLSPTQRVIAGTLKDQNIEPTDENIFKFEQAMQLSKEGRDFANRLKLAGAEATARANADQNASLQLAQKLGLPIPGVSGNGGVPSPYGPPKVDITGGKLSLHMTPPKSSPESQNIVARTQSILGMMPRAKQVFENTPDIPNISVEATRRLLPSKLAEHPGIVGAGEMALLGPPNPAYDQYFQTTGELNYAMTALATRLASRSGSAKMATLLSPHIPQIALQPSQNKAKIDSLFGPDSVLVQEFLPEGRRAVKTGDLSPDEFADILRGFQVINRTFTKDNRKYGVNARNEVIPLE